MASLTLKNLPDDLLDALRAAADRERRSLNQQIIHLLDGAIAGPAPSARRAGVDAQVAAWRKLAGKWESDLDPTIEAEQIVERRSRGRKVDL